MKRRVPPTPLLAVLCFGLVQQDLGAEPVSLSTRKRAEVFEPQPENIRSGYIWTAGKGTPESLALAIRDLISTFGPDYPQGPAFLERLKQIGTLSPTDASAGSSAFEELFQEALLSNPLLDFDSLLMARRKPGSGKKNQWDPWGFPRSSMGNPAVPANQWDSELVLLSPVSPEGKLTSVYQTPGRRLLDNPVLHWDGDRYLFSMRDEKNLWQIHEGYLDGRPVRQITLPDPDVHNYDACYLPDGDIIFCSTAVFQGVPCNSQIAGVLYRCGTNGENRRQLTFEQDQNHAPSVMQNGRVIYARWEYADVAHYFSRLVFHMNPDGTNQLAYYGSNAYWPNAFWGTREVPGKPGHFISVITGHHDSYRTGELVLFDAHRPRHGSGGVVQRIPGHKVKVKEIVCDELTTDSMPRFSTPHPLATEDPALGASANGKYFLVSGLMKKGGTYGIYLVDVFDNMVPVYRPGSDDSYFYPIPVKKVVTPPVLTPRTDLTRKDASVLISDIYRGPGLEGVPRGTVKTLRLFSYHYGFPKASGHATQGVESGWDVKRILGTVPVEQDGSAHFKVPANLPVSIQPLDESGRALQLMRSWTVGMPGEQVSCVGCHESPNMPPPQVPARAFLRQPSEIVPWNGPARPFVFRNDVQPVLDQYCVSCHDRSGAPPDLTDRGKDESYDALHPFVRRPGPESDNVLLTPMEYHASTSELVQLLERGHYQVKLDAAAWSRIYTWIDLNAQNKGHWFGRKSLEEPGGDHQKRMKMARKYTNNAIDPEAEFVALMARYERRTKPVPVVPKLIPRQPLGRPTLEGWPFDHDTAVALARDLGESRKTISLGTDCILELVRIPAGKFVTEVAGDGGGVSPKVVTIDRPFWIGTTEITNQQFGTFDPDHDSMYFDQQNKDHITRGYPANTPRQPVVRISSVEAEAFCQWLSTKSGERVALPTEHQWEWACRAGADTPFFFGDIAADFGGYANFADATLKNLAVRGVRAAVAPDPGPDMDFVPRVRSVDDGYLVTSDVGSYTPNAWGLHDMHGNVWEWTRTPAGANDDRVLAKGGSWRDRPRNATASTKLKYAPWQKVFNVGFRVIVEDP